MTYTLAHYYAEAGLTYCPDWAHEVTLPSPPYKHQIGDLNHLATYTRAGLLNDPGTGKTRPIQAYGLWLAAQSNKVIYLMPPVLLQQFKLSLNTTYQGHHNFIKSEVLNNTVTKRQQMIDHWDKSKWPELLIMSYRMFVQYQVLLLKKDYTCVIVDEATAVKNSSSQLHKAIKQFAGSVEESNGVVLLTGTAIETNPSDAYGIIALLNPTRYGSKKSFERMHVNFANLGSSNIKIVTGYKNFAYLRDSLFASSRRVKKSDCLDLPPRTIVEVPVNLSNSHMQLYKRGVDQRLAEVSGEVLDLTTASALYQFTQRVLICPESYTDHPPKENKLIEAIDTLLESLSGHKVILYVWYQASVEKLLDRYKTLNPASLYGKTKNREQERQKFITDAKCKLLIANVRSGGVGVDGLQHVCSQAIFAEICSFPGAFYQAIDRLHRSGQQSTQVTAYLLIPQKTVAIKLRNNLIQKDFQQELVMQDKRKVLADLLGVSGLVGNF